MDFHCRRRTGFVHPNPESHGCKLGSVTDSSAQNRSSGVPHGLFEAAEGKKDERFQMLCQKIIPLIGLTVLSGCATRKQDTASYKDDWLHHVDAERVQEMKELKSQLYILMHDVAAIRRAMDLAAKAPIVNPVIGTTDIGTMTRLQSRTPQLPPTPLPQGGAAGGNWQEEIKKLRAELESKGLLSK